jgi:murein DD-endopeptidase MepM/ murein hydrolase activator NlpD
MACSQKKSGGGNGLLLLLIVLAVIAIGREKGGAASLLPDTGTDTGGEFVAPADGRVTSGFGAHSGTTHYGLDIAAPHGDPIRAVADGTVIEAGPATGFGLWLRLRHDDGTVTVYGHMHTLTAEEGDRVNAGEQIATIGSRGQSTGPHLHFEVWPHGQRSARIDPAPWLAARGIDL